MIQACRSHQLRADRRFGHSFTLTMAAACILALGCSRSSLVEVSGEVTLDDQPVEQGVISFWPADGVGPTAQAVINEGKYNVEVAPGQKKVGVEAVEEKSKAYPSGPNGPAVPVHQLISPERYADPKQTDLSCEVNFTSNVHNFRLKSSGFGLLK